MDSAAVLLLAGCFGAGVLGGVLRAWHTINDTKALDLRLTRIEAALTSEVKRRAAESRPIKPSAAVLQELAASMPMAQPQKAKQPWDF